MRRQEEERSFGQPPLDFHSPWLTPSSSAAELRSAQAYSDRPGQTAPMSSLFLDADGEVEMDIEPQASPTNWPLLIILSCAAAAT